PQGGGEGLHAEVRNQSGRYQRQRTAVPQPNRPAVARGHSGERDRASSGLKRGDAEGVGAQSLVEEAHVTQRDAFISRSPGHAYDEEPFVIRWRRWSVMRSR